MTDAWTETEDGYRWIVEKLDGVTVDGYLATVITADGKIHGARCPTRGKASSWCRETIAKKRKET